MMALYSAALALGLLLSSPWWLVRMFTTERYREGLKQRLGAVSEALRAAVTGKRVIWIHAVSVGEVLAASRLLLELEAALGNGWIVVVSTTTRTGQALAKERFGADRVFYYPLDFAWAARAYLRALQPAALVLMESELWPRMLHECQQRKIPVTVANARVSDRSLARGMRVRSIWGRLLRKVSLWSAQSDQDAQRLLALGARQDSVQAVGNLKYDVRAPKQSPMAAQIRDWANGRAIIVAGSTCAANADGKLPSSEEPLLANACFGLVLESKRALLVVAPRHPERFEDAEEAFAQFRYVNASGRPAKNSAQKDQLEVVILDTIGDLAAVYGIADIAFVGGSLVKRGGHNPLEPAQFGVPVIMGPSFENFRDIVGKMQAADAIRIVEDEADLKAALTEMLDHPKLAGEMGERGRQVFEQQQGATARTVEAILSLLDTTQGVPQS